MKYLTNSEMKLYRRCRRAWWLTYVRRLRKKSDHNFNRPLGIGTRVHEALAAYYDPTDPRDPLTHLDASIRADLEKLPAFETDILKEADLCRAMLEGYLEWLVETGEDQALKVLAAEGARTAPLNEHVTLLAKLDARVYHEVHEARLALEHKTVDTLKQALPALQLDTQLLTEHLVEFLALREEGREGDVAQGVLYNMLRKVKRTASAKPPFYRREPVRHNLNELRNHWRHVQRLAEEMLYTEQLLAAGAEHHDVVPPNPTRDCSWDCQFFGVCPLFDDGSAVEVALTELYETADPLERYAGQLPPDANTVSS